MKETSIYYLKNVLFYILCTLIAVLMIMPFTWQILSVFKTAEELIYCRAKKTPKVAASLGKIIP